MSATVAEKTMLARRAVREEASIKLMVWGEPGAGKTRLALTFPDPIVVDLERGSRLYAGEFDFWVAEPLPGVSSGKLVEMLVGEIVDGGYPDRRTLVIDPVTDYLDSLESVWLTIQQQKGINFEALAGMAKSKKYAELREWTRGQLNKILALPMHVVFVARAKNVWGPGKDGKMQPIGRQADSSELIEYLCDLVFHLEVGGTAAVKKSRLAALPESIKAVTFADVSQALTAAPVAMPERLAGPAPSGNGSQEEAKRGPSRPRKAPDSAPPAAPAPGPAKPRFVVSPGDWLSWEQDSPHGVQGVVLRVVSQQDDDTILAVVYLHDKGDGRWHAMTGDAGKVEVHPSTHRLRKIDDPNPREITATVPPPPPAPPPSPAPVADFPTKAASMERLKAAYKAATDGGLKQADMTRIAKDAGLEGKKPSDLTPDEISAFEAAIAVEIDFQSPGNCPEHGEYVKEKKFGGLCPECTSSGTFPWDDGGAA